MSSCFEAGSDDRIHAGLLKCRTLFRCGRRANRDNALRPALLQDFVGGNSEDEAEHRHLRIDQRASLIFESRRRRIWFVCWKRRSQFGEMVGNWKKAPVEYSFIR